MQKRVVLIVLVQMLLAIPAFNANTKLSALQFFVGHWQGTVHGEAGSGTVERDYELVMNETFIRVRNKSVYPATGKESQGRKHTRISGCLAMTATEKNMSFGSFMWRVSSTNTSRTPLRRMERKWCL